MIWCSFALHGHVASEGYWQSNPDLPEEARFDWVPCGSHCEELEREGKSGAMLEASVAVGNVCRALAGTKAEQAHQSVA